MQMKQTKRGREDKEKREAGNNFWGEKGEGESALLAVAERKLIYAWCSVIGWTIFIYIYTICISTYTGCAICVYISVFISTYIYIAPIWCLLSGMLAVRVFLFRILLQDFISFNRCLVSLSLS